MNAVGFFLLRTVVGVAFTVTGIVGSLFPKSGQEAWVFAKRHGAAFRFRVHVVDVDGNPVEGASVNFSHYTAIGAFGAWKDQRQRISRLTDKDGMATISGRSVGEFCRMGVEKRKGDILKEGDYYGHGEDINFDALPMDERVRDGKWQPYDAVREVVLKPIRKRVPLVFDNVYFGCRLATRRFGLDLEQCDATTPRVIFGRPGKGKRDDIYFSIEESQTDADGQPLAGGEKAYRMTISFPNPGDGVYLAPSHPFSRLKSDYHARRDGEYMPSLEFVQVYDRRGVAAGCEIPEKSRQIPDCCVQHMVFRVRTKLDAQGNVVSANYGKLYGGDRGFRLWRDQRTSEWMWAFSMVSFFNPVPNDTNLETGKQLGEWGDRGGVGDNFR